MLCEAGQVTRYVYFPDTCFISLITRVEDGPGLEVGMVGREGMLGAQVTLGVNLTPMHALVQGPGATWRIDVARFRRELEQSTALDRVMRRYIHVLMGQLATSAACTRFHKVGPRLARWLLMSQDRAHSASFHLTQEFLAYMLGVRRVGITAAAGDLQRDGLIEYQRGRITVLNRRGLELVACSCYAADRDTYETVLKLTGRQGALAYRRRGAGGLTVEQQSL